MLFIQIRKNKYFSIYTFQNSYVTNSSKSREIVYDAKLLVHTPQMESSVFQLQYIDCPLESSTASLSSNFNAQLCPAAGLSLHFAMNLFFHGTL